MLLKSRTLETFLDNHILPYSYDVLPRIIRSFHLSVLRIETDDVKFGWTGELVWKLSGSNLCALTPIRGFL
jgi:hypothetical protein